MNHRELDDRALLTLARDGSAPAFAVLVYRHLPRVDHLIERDDDLFKARKKVFVHAMRKLDAATEPFGEWIEDLAASALPVTPHADRTRAATDTPDTSGDSDAPLTSGATHTPDATHDSDGPHVSGATRHEREIEPDAVERGTDVPAGTPADIDSLWRELAPRWPNGRRPVQVPTIVGWLATLVVTIALSAAVPWITLGQFDNDQPIPALRAFPIDADIGVATPDDDEEEPDEPEPLPTYEFPVPPEEDVEP
ncbi:MAG: hypothetical protein WD358_03465, partial [Nitriliruptoraceae bacterium]